MAEQQDDNELLQKLLEQPMALTQEQNALARQQIEAVSKRLATGASPVPATVVAPPGAASPASLIGREREPKRLMKGLCSFTDKAPKHPLAWQQAQQRK